MSRASVLARGRAAALAGMVDTCRITRVAGVVTDPDTGEQNTAYDLVYEGVCRVQQRTPGGARPADAGEAYLLLLKLELQIPATVDGVEVGDAVAITASAHDGDLLGRVYRVRELAHKTHTTAHRLGIEEVTG